MSNQYKSLKDSKPRSSGLLRQRELSTFRGDARRQGMFEGAQMMNKVDESMTSEGEYESLDEMNNQFRNLNVNRQERELMEASGTVGKGDWTNIREMKNYPPIKQENDNYANIKQKMNPVLTEMRQKYFPGRQSSKDETIHKELLYDERLNSHVTMTRHRIPDIGFSNETEAEPIFNTHFQNERNRKTDNKVKANFEIFQNVNNTEAYSSPEWRPINSLQQGIESEFLTKRKVDIKTASNPQDIGTFQSQRLQNREGHFRGRKEGDNKKQHACLSKNTFKRNEYYPASNIDNFNNPSKC